MIKLLDKICLGMAVASASLFIFCTFSICYNILTRSLGLPSLIWITQFNEYAMLWITFLGSPYLLSKNKHVSIQIIAGTVGEKGKKWLGQICNLLGTLLCLGLFYFCLSSTWDHFVRNVIDVQSVDVPQGYVLMVIPLGFFLLFLQFLRRLSEGFRGSRDALEPGKGGI